MSFAGWLIGKYSQRKPNMQIGGAENPYLNRWYIIPRNPVFNIYLHQFMRDDDDRAHHDHPWPSVSLLLRGELHEFIGPGPTWTFARRMKPGRWSFRSPWLAHRLEIPPKQRGNTWTLFITGPRLREWGFRCPQGWVHWRDFTAGKNGELIGAGCGEYISSSHETQERRGL